MVNFFGKLGIVVSVISSILILSQSAIAEQVTYVKELSNVRHNCRQTSNAAGVRLEGRFQMGKVIFTGTKLELNGNDKVDILNLKLDKNKKYGLILLMPINSQDYCPSVSFFQHPTFLGRNVSIGINYGSIEHSNQRPRALKIILFEK